MEVEWRAKGEFLHTDSMILTENSVHFLFAALFMTCQLDEHNVHNTVCYWNDWKKMPVVFVAWATDGNKLSAKSICKTAPKSLFWALTCIPGFKNVPWLAC